MARKKQARPKRGGVDDDDGDFATTITDTTSDLNSQQEDGRYPLSFFLYSPSSFQNFLSAIFVSYHLDLGFVRFKIWGLPLEEGQTNTTRRVVLLFLNASIFWHF